MRLINATEIECPVKNEIRRIVNKTTLSLAAFSRNRFESKYDIGYYKQCRVSNVN